LLALASPRPFDPAREEAITVEVVTPQEVAARAAAPSQSETQTQAEANVQAGSGSARSELPPDQPAPASEPERAFSMLDPAGLALFNMRPGSSGFDSKADTPTDLRQDEIAAFKSHLRRCWRLPNSTPATSPARVVIRVALGRDGALAGEPTLVEASASQEGPAVYQAAMRALNECQPFSFLPADRYREWKVLDVSFSPQEMSGG
jgi:hypothetical protein